MNLPNIDKPGLVDLHCHILPGVDDGSRSTEESLELIRLAYEQGFRTFIATPHYRRTRENPDIEALTAELTQAVKERCPDMDDIDIYPGQEGLWHEEYPERIAAGQARTLAGSDYILCEFDFTAPYGQISRGLHTIADTGHTPVLAHYERYPALREGNRVYDIKRMGVVLQMNYEVLAGSGLNALLDKNMKWCRRQTAEGMVDILATDMHRTDFRPPDTLRAQDWLRKKISADRYDIITRRNALHIIKNEELEM